MAAVRAKSRRKAQAAPTAMAASSAAAVRPDVPEEASLATSPLLAQPSAGFVRANPNAQLGPAAQVAPAAAAASAAAQASNVLPRTVLALQPVPSTTTAQARSQGATAAQAEPSARPLELSRLQPDSIGSYRQTGHQGKPHRAAQPAAQVQPVTQHAAQPVTQPGTQAAAGVPVSTPDKHQAWPQPDSRGSFRRPGHQRKPNRAAPPAPEPEPQPKPEHEPEPLGRAQRKRIMTSKGADLVAQQQAETTAVAGKTPAAGRRAKRRADEDPIVLEDVHRPGSSAVAVQAPKRAKVDRPRQASGDSTSQGLPAPKAAGDLPGSASNAAGRHSHSSAASAFAEGLHLLSTVMEDQEMVDANQPMLQASVLQMQGAQAAQQDTVHRLQPAGKTKKKDTNRSRGNKKPVWH